MTIHLHVVVHVVVHTTRPLNGTEFGMDFRTGLVPVNFSPSYRYTGKFGILNSYIDGYNSSYSNKIYSSYTTRCFFMPRKCTHSDTDYLVPTEGFEIDN